MQNGLFSRQLVAEPWTFSMPDHFHLRSDHSKKMSSHINGRHKLVITLNTEIFCHGLQHKYIAAARTGSGGMAPLILNLDTRTTCVVSFTFVPLYPEKVSRYTFNGKMVLPQTWSERTGEKSIPPVGNRIQIVRPIVQCQCRTLECNIYQYDTEICCCQS
jgi:hypothetical protein